MGIPMCESFGYENPGHPLRTRDLSIPMDPLIEAMVLAAGEGLLSPVDVLRCEAMKEVWFKDNYERVVEALTKLSTPVPHKLLDWLVEKNWMSEEQRGIVMVKQIDI